MNSAPAGNIVGIGGLENYILKSATLSSEWACPPFVESVAGSVPILRVAVEPAKSTGNFNAIQWGSEIQPFEIQKHSKSRLFEGWISNGPYHSKTRKNCGFSLDHLIYNFFVYIKNGLG